MVDFREVLDPAYDPGARYVVAYEAHFEPTSLDQSRIELDVTKEGRIGIGFELEERVARRLGFKSKSHRVVSGHEPAARFNRQALLGYDIQQQWYRVRPQWRQYTPMTRLLGYRAW